LAGFLNIYLSAVTSFLREHWILEAVVSLKLLANNDKYCQTISYENTAGGSTIFIIHGYALTQYCLFPMMQVNKNTASGKSI